MCFKSHANQKESHCRLSFQSHRTSLYSRSHIHEIYQVKCLLCLALLKSWKKPVVKLWYGVFLNSLKDFFSMYKDTSQPWWQKCYRSVIHYISAEMTASAGGVIRVMSFLCFVGSLEVYTRDK